MENIYVPSGVKKIYSTYFFVPEFEKNVIKAKSNQCLHVTLSGLTKEDDGK